MNLYFIVEGKTERLVYPEWIKILLPLVSRVQTPADALENNFFLISGGGYPSILSNHLVNSVDDINTYNNFDYLVLVIDTDDESYEEKIIEVETYVAQEGIVLNNCKLVIIPQTVCFETWLLGNKRIFVRQTEDLDCLKLSNHFDASKNDPEQMIKMDDYPGTNANFHFKYLKTMLRVKNVSYTKSKPHAVSTPDYLERLFERITNNPESLKSMKIFFDFMKSLSS